mgnify:CR=1 FL=1
MCAAIQNLPVRTFLSDDALRSNSTIICASFVLMILQAVAHLFRDIAIWRGEEI